MTDEPDRTWEDQYAGWEAPYRIPPDRIRRWMRKPPVSWLYEWAELGRGSRVLEAGCGGGAHGIALALLGCDVTLLDYAQAPLESARANFLAVQERFLADLDVTFRCDDLLNPSIVMPQDHVLVYNIGVVEHIREHQSRVDFLRAMAAAARPGGYVAVAIPNNCHPWAGKWQRSGFPWLQEGHRLQEMVLPEEEVLRMLQDAGLTGLRLDGYAVHDTLLKWPKRRWLEYPVRGLARVLEIPFRKVTRLRWGTWWLAMGRVGGHAVDGDQPSGTGPDQEPKPCAQ
jgi:SAM-dependent methyltransferase